jgi:hypothetical protein
LDAIVEAATMISGLHMKIRGWMKPCADIFDWEGHWGRYCKRYFRRGQRGERKRCDAKVTSASGQLRALTVWKLPSA